MRGTHSASTEAIQLGCHEDALCERERALWNQGDSQNPGAELSDQGHIEPAVTMPMRQRTLVTTVIPLLAWVVAGVANYDQFWMGDTPSVLGTTATLVAIGLALGGLVLGPSVRIRVHPTCQCLLDCCGDRRARPRLGVEFVANGPTCDAS